jgi:hypothetical protein
MREARVNRLPQPRGGTKIMRTDRRICRGRIVGRIGERIEVDFVQRVRRVPLLKFRFGIIRDGQDGNHRCDHLRTHTLNFGLAYKFN